MFTGLKTKFYSWLDYKKVKNNIGISLADYERLKNYKADYIENMLVKFKGKEIQITSPFWFLHSVQEIFIEEVYKFNPKKSQPVIIDCGANIGLSVTYFKQLCPDAHITAFEADPNVFKTLQRNINEFSLTNVTLVNKAVWMENTVLEFNSEGTVGGRLGLGEVVIKNKVEVKTIRLREMLDTKVDFLKIDIEGAEYAVLKDCVDKLDNVDKLFIEYHVMPAEHQFLDEMLLWIRQAGFRYYIKEAWENKRYPFMETSNESYEMQLNISCYR